MWVRSLGIGREKCWRFIKSSVQWVQRIMEDMVESFAARLTLTSEEQMVVLVDDKEGAFLRMTKVFLVGRVLCPKPVVKERFKRQMMHLWRPKAKVMIVDLDDDLFSFSFETKCERVMVLKGGLWLYDGALLILVETDTLAHPNTIQLSS